MPDDLPWPRGVLPSNRAPGLGAQGVKRVRTLSEGLDQRLPQLRHNHQGATYRERREFIGQEFLPLVRQLEMRETNPSDQIVTDTLSMIDWPHVQDAWRKALDRRFDDPDGAITAARTLLESACKHILELEDIEGIDKFDLPKLYDAAAKTLNLANASDRTSYSPDSRRMHCSCERNRRIAQ